MSLECRTVVCNGNKYTRLIGEKITSEQEIAELAEVILGGNYFYGGILDTGDEIRSFFGQGPNHDIFKQMIQEIDGRSGIDKRARKIGGVLFLEDPGKKANLLSISDNDVEGVQRRESRISAIARKLPKDLCERQVLVRWCEGYDHMTEYVYLPQNDELKKW